MVIILMLADQTAILHQSKWDINFSNEIEAQILRSLCLKSFIKTFIKN
jgi:hypothetical protein